MSDQEKAPEQADDGIDMDTELELEDGTVVTVGSLLRAQQEANQAAIEWYFGAARKGICKGYNRRSSLRDHGMSPHGTRRRRRSHATASSPPGSPARPQRWLHRHRSPLTAALRVLSTTSSARAGCASLATAARLPRDSADHPPRR